MLFPKKLTFKKSMKSYSLKFHEIPSEFFQLIMTALSEHSCVHNSTISHCSMKFFSIILCSLLKNVENRINNKTNTLGRNSMKNFYHCGGKY